MNITPITYPGGTSSLPLSEEAMRRLHATQPSGASLDLSSDWPSKQEGWAPTPEYQVPPLTAPATATYQEAPAAVAPIQQSAAPTGTGWTTRSLGTGGKSATEGVLTGVQQILSQPSASTGNDPGAMTMGIIGSTVAGAATGAAAGAPIAGVGAIPGAVVGGVLGLGKGIISAVMGKKSADEADAKTAAANKQSAKYNRQADVLNTNAMIETAADQRHNQDKYYESLDPMAFSRNLMIGFTRAHQG